MNKQLKQQMLLIFFGVALFAALTNLNEVAGFFRVLAGILSPVVSGLLLAFVLSVPMLGIARRLAAHFPKMKEKAVDALSLTLTMLCVAVLVFLLCVLAIPQLAASVRSIAVLVRENWPDWVALLSSYGVDTTELTKLAASFDWKTAVEKLFTGAGAVIGSVVDLASSTVSVTVNAVFAFIPYIGAFASCLIGVLLTLLAAPEKAILCFLVYQVVQFIENQFIYPHVVGGSVGLSPLWTLLAALLGGKLFGIIGIVFFIPLAAVISQLLQGDIEQRLTAREKMKSEK